MFSIADEELRTFGIAIKEEDVNFHDDDYICKCPSPNPPN
jgi:hypothetical protein